MNYVLPDYLFGNSVTVTRFTPGEDAEGAEKKRPAGEVVRPLKGGDPEPEPA